MTRPLDRHLDIDELDGLVSPQSASPAQLGSAMAQALEEARRHIESCPGCREKVRMHQCVQDELAQLGVSTCVSAEPDCGVNVDWLEVAAGLLSEIQIKGLMKHASQCGHCGPLLRQAAKTLSDEATPKEEEFLATLGSSQPSNWQSEIAMALQGNRQDRRANNRRSFRWRIYLWWPTMALTAAALSAVGVAWISVRSHRPASAEELLAQAYTEHRTIEVRIPGAKYAPIRVERGSGGSRLDTPPPLLKAEALISDQLAKSPNDPDWLQAKARADLLDGNSESAIQSLEKALMLRPNSPSMLTDLGTAYFVRGEATDRPIDYGNAVDSLDKALSLSPDEPVALFNDALACQKMFLYKQAEDDWERYLRVDSRGAWSDDARRRLTALKEALRQHDKSQASPLLTPKELSNVSAEDAATLDRIDARIEEYLRVAVVDWLPQAFPRVGERPSRDAQAALSELAAITKTRHDDDWLEDLLDKTAARTSPAGVAALSQSLRANERGDYAQAQKYAHLAGLLLKEGGNDAGEVRAQAEEVYSDHLLWEGPRCLALLGSLFRRLDGRKYRWIEAQMRLEQSNCANAVGDLGTYQAAISRGLKISKRYKYPALYLRALGFQALSDASLGNAASAFSYASTGLEMFWSGQIDIMKGYNAYANLDVAADELRLPNLRVALWREATEVIDRHPDVLQRAMAHRWYGKAAYLANMPSVAAAQFAEASSLFALSPKTVATTRDQTDAEIWLANAEIQQGAIERAAGRLRSIEPMLKDAPSFEPQIEFYSTEADIAIRRADNAAAETALRSAIFLAESALGSYSSEEDRRRLAEQTRSAYHDAVEWRLRQGNASSALELWEWYRGADLRADNSETLHRTSNLEEGNLPNLRDAPPLPSPTLVSSRLPLLSKETIVVYGAFPDGIAVWVYDDRGIYWKWIPNSLVPVEQLALHMQELCSDPASDLATLKTKARSLYNLLIAPVEDRLDWGRTIVFEPDDILAVVPWEALMDHNSRYLVERSAIIVAPALYRAVNLRSATLITPKSPTLIVSVPVPLEQGFTPLTDAQSEAATVAEQFPSSLWLQGTHARLSTIRREIRGIRVFHFAGHAIASAQRAGLVLAELDPRTGRSRLVNAESLAKRDIDTLQLAVLSACQSEAAGQAGDTGAEGLAEFFLDAGVPNVIASRWNVDSGETEAFMKEFYSHLLAGESASAAMHTAQLELLHKPTSAHPYYWAAFEFQGNR